MGFWSTASTSASRVITTTATVVETSARVIDSAASGLDMLDAYVVQAKAKQTFSHSVSDDTWRSALIDQAAEAEAQRLRNLEKSLSSDQRLATLFTGERDRLRAKFLTP